MESGTRFSSSANDDKSREPNGKRFSIDDSVVSSLEPSASAKRARMTKLPSSIPTCQVLGCKKDLSSSKDYHKRHKVCDVHSKTAAVIVNGIQQRFCQQCSRFHIISEFDEGKRSCRKRLVGHNERRRKPQFDTYMGSSFLSTDESKTSSLSPAILPDGFYDPPYNNPINHSRHLKLEFGRSLPNSRLVKKPSPPKHGLNTSLYVSESSVSSNSGCALSLLSTPHQNYHSTICTLENPAKPNSRQYSSTNFTPMSFNPYGVDQEGLPLVPDEMSRIEISPTFDALNGSSYLSPEGSDTVSLHALSLHLRRLEEQKDSGETEYRVFCNSNYTR